MTSKITSGFEEVEHTADVCLKIWGKTLEELFRVALQGLYHCSQVSYDQENVKNVHKQQIVEMDNESLLVSFLSECNYMMQFEHSYFVPIKIKITKNKLICSSKVFSVIDFQKEIKAVTFHKLEIRNNEQGYSTYIVFDV